MNRIDDAIKDIGYILDCLIAYRRITESGCCNDCEYKKGCEYAPMPGSLVRYNCPFYDVEVEHDTDR